MIKLIDLYKRLLLLEFYVGTRKIIRSDVTIFDQEKTYHIIPELV